MSECTCNDSHCETCHPETRVFHAIQEGIEYAKMQSRTFFPHVNPLEVQVIAQFAAAHTARYLLKKD